jgi:uncharacterized damage-inducible protein DinB
LPQSNEYVSYYAKYVSLVPEEDIIDAMGKQLVETLAVVRRIPEEKTAEQLDGKWSVRQIVGHLCDGERNFSYRAYRFAHNDLAPLPGFEQDDYVREGDANQRSLDDLLDEFALLRRSSIAAFRRLTPERAMRTGVASGNPITVRALLYILVGHERHHVEGLRKRFGV